ncbi:MAG: SGNH hydrolase domain-containing protein [Candidatus Nanopelagicales bacterium]
MRRGRVLAAAALTTFALALTALPGAATAATPSVVIAPTWTPIPSYSAAKHDEPITYANGCHVKGVVTTPKVCTFSSGTRTVMLFGDSHANHWFGAVLNAARVGGWKFKTMTKSGCPAVKVSVKRYKSANFYPECDTWRARALSGLTHVSYGKIDVLVMSSWHFHQVLTSTYGVTLTGANKYAKWKKGMTATLTAALKGVKQIVILRDSPDLPGDMLQAQACYAAYGLAAQTKCGTTLAKATSAGIWNAERKAVAELPAALRARVRTVDLTTATCPNNWCGPIDGPYLAFKDDNHWTQTWVKARMNKPIYTQVKAAMLRGA